MKYMITAAAILACLLLCSCEGGKEDSVVTDSTTEITTTISESAPGTTENVTDSGEVTTAKITTETTAQSGTTNTSAAADKADIAIGGEPADGTAAKPSDSAGPETTQAAQSSETEADVNSGNILPDDGLNWSPLVPLN